VKKASKQSKSDDGRDVKEPDAETADWVSVLTPEEEKLAEGVEMLSRSEIIRRMHEGLEKDASVESSSSEREDSGI
jgi:hypothetical protein